MIYEMLVGSFCELESFENEAGAFLMALGNFFDPPTHPSLTFSFVLLLHSTILPISSFRIHTLCSYILRFPCTHAQPFLQLQYARTSASPQPRPAARSPRFGTSYFNVSTVRFSGTLGAFIVGGQATDRSGPLILHQTYRSIGRPAYMLCEEVDN
jgi:hypothetical protein